MNKARLIPHIFTVLLMLAAASVQATALDDYIASNDSAYSFELYHSTENTLYTTYFLKLTSLQWRDAVDVDCTRRLQDTWLDACNLWQHELIVYVPRLFDLLGEPTGLVIISGGNNTGEMRREEEAAAGYLAAVSNAVIAEIRQIPNQPYFFNNDPGRLRKEDALLGYSFEQFFSSGETDWPALAPMTKATVKAMDAVQDFVAMQNARPVKDFVVTGGSKRGWTTWLTAAVDSRVKAIMPASIDITNLPAQLDHHHAGYGFFTLATNDYIEANLPCRKTDPKIDAFLALVDPWVYNSRYTMPKLVLNSSGDQFFPSDAARFYYQALPEPKHLRMTLNTDHKQDISAISSGLLWLQEALDDPTPGPSYQWWADADGTLHVTTAGDEEEVLLWQAHNPKARDFRLEEIGAAWTSTPLTQQTNGEYIATVPVPDQGWTAYLIEVRYQDLDAGDLGTLSDAVTTEVMVVPQDIPHQPFDCSQALNLASGLWANAAEIGPSVTINQLLDRSVVFGPWYLYDENAQPFWFTFTGALEGTRSKGLLHAFNGPVFGQPGGSAQAEQIGQASLAFLSQTEAMLHLTFQLNGISVDRELSVREFDPRSSGGYSGLWANQDYPNQGFQFAQKAHQFYGTWFTYDSSGENIWYLFIGNMPQDNVAEAQLWQFSGPMPSQPWDKDLVSGTVVGSVRIEFSSTDDARFNYSLNGSEGNFPLSRFNP